MDSSEPNQKSSVTDVKALLDQLRASEAWREALTPKDTANPEDPPPSEAPQGSSSKPPASGAPSSEPEPAPNPNVASLLAQLQHSSAVTSLVQPRPRSSGHAKSEIPAAAHFGESPSSSAETDPYYPTQSQSLHERPSVSGIERPPSQRSISSFQQALPVIAQLSEDPAFVRTVKDLQMQQDKLEQHLWEERTEIRKKHEKKVELAQKKATMIGASISAHEAKMMQDAFARDMKKFDTERVINAWEDTIANQQSTLQALGVPLIFQTTDSATRKAQQKIAHVLEGLSTDGDPGEA